jgi:dethiobiotin synthetase
VQPDAHTKPRIAVVTGTDTGVGKTYVACMLARALTALGRKVVAIKLVETGIDESNPSQSEDGAQLARATGQAAPTRALVRLAIPVTPLVAAHAENKTIDADVLKTIVLDFASRADITLVEGAGGLLSPLTESCDLDSFARDLGASMIVVAPNRLGALNALRLTVRELERQNISLRGVVFSDPPSLDGSSDSNVGVFSQLHPAVRVVRWPFDREMRFVQPHVSEFASLLF